MRTVSYSLACLVRFHSYLAVTVPASRPYLHPSKQLGRKNKLRFPDNFVLRVQGAWTHNSGKSRRRNVNVVASSFLEYTFYVSLKTTSRGGIFMCTLYRWRRGRRASGQVDHRPRTTSQVGVRPTLSRHRLRRRSLRLSPRFDQDTVKTFDF